MGLGAIGPGVGEGMVAAKACEAIGKNPGEAGLLTRTMPRCRNATSIL